jgi:stage II sporulation protein D
VLTRAAALLSLLLTMSRLACARDVRIGVLGIFHPRQMVLDAAPGDILIVKAAGETFALEPGHNTGGALLRVSAGAILVEIGGRVLDTSEVRATSRKGDAVAFVIGIPGKISRTYRGTLLVKAVDGLLVPVVNIDLETAVATAVQAESAPDLPFEALKAQTVVTRSYYTAGRGRHHDFDFCDLSHCQLVQGPPSPQSPAVRAAQATRGLVIAYQDAPVAAMFARSCGGRTRTPAELGMPSKGYPYFSVVCDYCHFNPVKWLRRISPKDAASLIGTGEAGRLAVGRRLGWDAVPSNNFAMHDEGGEVVLEGEGEGHGIGFCQRGASAMAEAGSSFREILSHYFPNTTLMIPRPPHSS